MNIASTAKKSSSVSLVIFSFFICMQHTVWGQQVEIKGYDKASYNVSQAGRFMQTWLVTGPVAVSNDTTAPADKLQEEVFKAEEISQVKIIFDKLGLPSEIEI